ncbi:hypothetical protein B1H58_14440 [Pantoea alhagi]|uniref:Uncharacterized protein n=1 Tax=Pantoea alhagi TaxID=1891675 RepID=A0A1W6B7Q6_9GAMM|nr:hypothetical protein [Pantoea alhagi]ARJ43111.1 hypothetical protein B1H58_14440 [Pantoea alhagi]
MSSACYNARHNGRGQLTVYEARLQPVRNVHFNLMDEMLVSVIHGQGQRLNIATVAGPVGQPMSTGQFATCETFASADRLG